MSGTRLLRIVTMAGVLLVAAMAILAQGVVAPPIKPVAIPPVIQQPGGKVSKVIFPSTIPADTAIPIALQIPAGPPVETELDGIKLGMDYRDILMARGLPHAIGPSMEGPDAIFKIYDAPKTPDKPPKPDMPPDPVTTPPADAAAGAAGAAAAAAPAPAYTPPAPTPVDYIEPLNEYIVWIYVGHGPKPNPDADYSTYIFFDRKSEVNPKTGETVGVLKVIGVAIRATKVGYLKLNLRGGVNFGTTLTALAMGYGYGWPQQLAVISNWYWVDYPDKQVAFTLDVPTRKVIGVSIGEKTRLMVIPKGTDMAAPASGAPDTGTSGLPVPAGGAPAAGGGGGLLPAPAGVAPGAPR